MPSKKSSNDEGVLPGLGGFIQPAEEEWMWLGQKNETYFDAARLPDAPKQSSREAQTNLIYLLFPDQETMIRAMHALSYNHRKSIPKKVRIVSINSVAVHPVEGITFLELWEREMLGIEPQKEEVDPDEAQAPI